MAATSFDLSIELKLWEFDQAIFSGQCVYAKRKFSARGVDVFCFGKAEVCVVCISTQVRGLIIRFDFWFRQSRLGLDSLGLEFSN